MCIGFGRPLVFIRFKYLREEKLIKGSKKVKVEEREEGMGEEEGGRKGEERGGVGEFGILSNKKRSPSRTAVSRGNVLHPSLRQFPVSSI